MYLVTDIWLGPVYQEVELNESYITAVAMTNPPEREN